MKVLKYHLIMLSPQSTVKKKANTIKGPKGIGSLLVFIPVMSKISEMIAPSIKDKNILNIMYLVPKINPKEDIRITSPSPIPPFDNITITKNTPPPNTNPPRLSNISKESYI